MAGESKPTTPARLLRWAEEFDIAALFFGDVIVQPLRSPSAVKVIPRLEPDPNAPDGFRRTYESEEIENPPPELFGEISSAAWTRLGQLWCDAAKDVPGATVDTRMKDFGAIEWLMGQSEWYIPHNTVGIEHQPPMNPFALIATRLRSLAESNQLTIAPINEWDVKRLCSAAFDCRNSARNFRNDVLRFEEDLRLGITAVETVATFRQGIKSDLGMLSDRLGRFNREDVRVIDAIKAAVPVHGRFTVGDQTCLTAVEAARLWCEETLSVVQKCNLDCSVASRSDDAAWFELLCRRIKRLDVIDLAADIEREELQTTAKLHPKQAIDAELQGIDEIEERVADHTVRRKDAPTSEFAEELGRVIRRLKAKPDLLRAYIWDHADTLNVSAVNTEAVALGLGPVFVIGDAPDWATAPNLPADHPVNQRRIECLTVLHPDGSEYRIRRTGGMLDDLSTLPVTETIARLESWINKSRDWPNPLAKRGQPQQHVNSSKQSDSTTEKTEPKAKTRLFGWEEILKAVDQRDTPEIRNRVRRLNSQFQGPIKVKARGSRPTCDKLKLLEWWNALDDRYEDSRQRTEDVAATVAAQHNYGQLGIVAPDIAGSVKRRRTSTSKKITKPEKTSD